MKYASVLLMLLTVIIDRIVKISAQSSVLHGSAGFVTFTYYRNYGATMGIFRGDRVFLTTIGTIVVVVLVAKWFKSRSRSFWFWSGWALLMGGRWETYWTG